MTTHREDGVTDGGPAFPNTARKEDQFSGHAFTRFFSAHSGMSLRDYFAGQAMTGFLLGARSEGWAIPNDHQNKMLAANAYATADAMIAFRAASTP